MTIELRTSNNRLDVKYTFDKKNKAIYYQFGNTIGSRTIWSRKKQITHNTNADLGSLEKAISIYCEREGIKNKRKQGNSYGRGLNKMLFK